MRCKTCNSILQYHTSGVTCRNCGFKIGHEFLLESKCQSCHNVLEELEKTTVICVSFLFQEYNELFNLYSDQSNCKNNNRNINSTLLTYRLGKVSKKIMASRKYKPWSAR